MLPSTCSILTPFSADFTHNITDGLAMSASFYASPTIGATTTVAVFFHEIPHEVGDFALLIQSGFSKRAAMASQFVTAIGALMGTLIGIAVQELGSGAADGEAMPRNGGLWGTSLVKSFSSFLLFFFLANVSCQLDMGRYAAAFHGGHVPVRRYRRRHPGAARDGAQQGRGAAEDAYAVCGRCSWRGHHAVHFMA